MFDELNEDNFMMYAMKCYEAPNCIMSEFESDIKRTKYLKRLFRRYKMTGSLKERLILNHIILLNNVFGPEPTARILFYKIDERDYDLLKTFLDFLRIMPDEVRGINGKTIYSADIALEPNVTEILLSI
jgi:hypothetical protein